MEGGTLRVAIHLWQMQHIQVAGSLCQPFLLAQQHHLYLVPQLDPGTDGVALDHVDMRVVERFR
jgi:hypothetical protein